MTQSDENLMRAIQRGDEDAFDRLYQRHAAAVRARLAAIVRDNAAAEDLAQEVFLRVWTRAEQWTERGKVAGWLVRIGTNLALNHLRTVRRRRVKPLPPGPVGSEESRAEPVWPADESAPGPGELLDWSESLEWLRQSLEALPESKRAVVKLIYEDDMDIQAAAEELGVPVGTVKSRLHHARKRLAEMWKQFDGEWEDV